MPVAGSPGSRGESRWRGWGWRGLCRRGGPQGSVRSPRGRGPRVGGGQRTGSCCKGSWGFHLLCASSVSSHWASRAPQPPCRGTGLPTRAEGCTPRAGEPATESRQTYRSRGPRGETEQAGGYRDCSFSGGRGHSWSRTTGPGASQTAASRQGSSSSPLPWQHGCFGSRN